MLLHTGFLNSGPPVPVFSWDQSALEVPPASLSFSRASVAQILTSTDGSSNWYQQAKVNEIRYELCRRVENLLDSANGQGPFSDIDKIGRLAVSVEASNGTLTITIGGTPTVFTPTATPQRFVVFADVNGPTAITITGTATLSNPMAHCVRPAAGGDIPEPYVQHDATFNANVPGVQYFPTANTSTVDGAGVVTDLAGANFPDVGVLIEDRITNTVNDSFDLTAASWFTGNSTTNFEGVSEIGLRYSSVLASAGSAQHQAFVSVGTMEAGNVIARAGTLNFMLVRHSGGSTGYTVFDLAAGTVTETAETDFASVKPLGDGWFQCSWQRSTGAGNFCVINISDTGTPGTGFYSFNAAGTESLEIANVFVHSGLTSDNVLSGSTPVVSSGGDEIKEDDVATGVGWVASDPWTILIDHTIPDTAPGLISTLAGLVGTQPTEISLSQGTAMSFDTSGGGATSILASSAAPTIGARIKTAVRGELNNARINAGGSIATDATTGPIPVGNLAIGARPGVTSSHHYGGRIHKVDVYTQALSDADMDGLI